MRIDGREVDCGNALIMGEEPDPCEYSTREEYEVLSTEYFFDEMNMAYESWCRSALDRYLGYQVNHPVRWDLRDPEDRYYAKEEAERLRKLSALVSDMWNRAVYRWT